MEARAERTLHSSPFSAGASDTCEVCDKEVGPNQRTVLDLDGVPGKDTRGKQTASVSLRLLLEAPGQPESVAHSLSSMSKKLQLQQEIREREGQSALLFGGLWWLKNAH
jgi:hypothetical protein